MPGARGEELLTFDELERRPGVPADLRRRARRALDQAPEARFGPLIVERRGSNLVALRRAAPEDDLPRWRRVALEELERAAVAGDPRARRALRDIGQPAPPPRHWSEPDEEGA